MIPGKKSNQEAAMEELYIPTLHNTIYINEIASFYPFRFRAAPVIVMATPKEVDFEKSSIHAEYWHGLYCYEKSTMEGEKTFPLSAQGREELIAWLKEKI